MQPRGRAAVPTRRKNPVDFTDDQSGQQQDETGVEDDERERDRSGRLDRRQADEDDEGPDRRKQR